MASASPRRRDAIWLAPLIEGEAPPPFENGLPQYATLSQDIVAKKLPAFDA